MNRRDFFIRSGALTALGAFVFPLRRDVRFESLVPGLQLGWRKIVNGVPVKTIYMNEVMIQSESAIKELDLDFYHYAKRNYDSAH